MGIGYDRCIVMLMYVISFSRQDAEIMRSIHCDLHKLDEVAYILSGGGGVDDFTSEYVENVDDCVSVFENMICGLIIFP